jgi:hypothetical protein
MNFQFGLAGGAHISMKRGVKTRDNCVVQEYRSEFSE